MHLNVSFDKPIEPFGAKAVEQVISALKNELKIPAIVINVRVTSAQNLQSLNKKYAGKDEATDVLSFNYQEGSPAAEERAGDIVISYDHVQDQAQSAGTDKDTELALLVLHGSLHLLGYDHQNARQQARLDRLQAKLMSQAGLSYRDFGWQS